MQSNIKHNTAPVFSERKTTRGGETFLNNTGKTDSFETGTLVGRVSSTGQIIPFKSDASDGSQYPIGALVHEITDLEGNTTIKTSIVVEGTCLSPKLQGSDTMTSTVANAQGRLVVDLLASAGVHIKELNDLTI